ncbi:MAG: ADP-ribosylglycohydrolase family protein [bacterium]
MAIVTLSESDYRDKVYGCWLGKNCGGTLGTPLESGYGKEELFDVWWYPKLQEGGMPNDDLEIQLIWLKAIEERGLDIKARDLAEYWLDCIKYNFDEYGLNKTNLRKGLMPPVSGYFNNWFKHCMGSPIRSEIWACIAPGLPQVAAAYAYEDAIVDHAGGESVYGEMFNAAVESAAFVIGERDELLEIGLSLIPENCETAKAIRDAREAHSKGMDWKEARNFVLRRHYSPIAQYSPVNLAFQTIGWLYGEDFGDALCKAVNCGYDTDCTGATLGSILGIILGAKGLPKKWTEPLGDVITTNASWGGIANLEEPKNLDELTERTCEVGKKVLALHGGSVAISDKTDLSRVGELDLKSPKSIKHLWSTPPTRVDFDLKTMTLGVDYIDGPSIEPGAKRSFKVILRNPHPEELSGEVIVSPPLGWDVKPKAVRRVTVEPKGEATLDFSIRAGDVKSVETSNRGSIRLTLKERSQIEDVPLVFLGANRWLVSKAFRFKGEPDLDVVFPPEKDPAPEGPGVGWRARNFPENELKIEDLFRDEPGAIYLRHYVLSPDARPVHVGVPSTCPMRLWLNGKVVHESRTGGILRPNYAGDGRNYTDVKLKKGWNQFLIKIVRCEEPAQAHFIICGPKRLYHGFADLIECRFPWED